MQQIASQNNGRQTFRFARKPGKIGAIHPEINAYVGLIPTVTVIQGGLV